MSSTGVVCVGSPHKEQCMCVMQMLVSLSLRQDDSGLPVFHSCASELKYLQSNEYIRA